MARPGPVAAGCRPLRVVQVRARLRDRRAAPSGEDLERYEGHLRLVDGWGSRILPRDARRAGPDSHSKRVEARRRTNAHRSTSRPEPSGGERGKWTAVPAAPSVTLPVMPPDTSLKAGEWNRSKSISTPISSDPC